MARKPTKKMLIVLAFKYAGVQKDVAEACGVVRQTVAQWQLKDLKFDDAMKKGNDVLVDLSISGLLHHLKEKSEKSIHFTLDRLAREKGFGKMIQVTDRSKFEEQLAVMTEEEMKEKFEKEMKRIQEG